MLDEPLMRVEELTGGKVRENSTHLRNFCAQWDKNSAEFPILSDVGRHDFYVVYASGIGERVPYALHVRFRPWRQGLKEYVSRFSVGESSSSLTRRLDAYFSHLTQVVRTLNSRLRDVPAEKPQIKPATPIEEGSWYDLPF